MELVFHTHKYGGAKGVMDLVFYPTLALHRHGQPSRGGGG